MREYTHDEIVASVDKALIDIAAKVLEELQQDRNLAGDLLLSSRVKQLLSFLRNNRFEMLRRINRPPRRGVKERPDIEMFGGCIVVEVKSKDSELDAGREQLEEYIRSYYGQIAMIGIVTTGLDWVVCRWDERARKLKVLTRIRGDEREYEYSIYNAVIKSRVRETLHNIIKSVLLESSVYRLEPTPENIFRAFYPVMAYVNDLVRLVEERGLRDKALYKSYREILLRIYRDIKSEELDRLFAAHTLLQMVTNVVLVGALGKLEEAFLNPLRACSGEIFEYGVAIPHLMWWREEVSAGEGIVQEVGEACGEIVSRALLFDWSSQVVEDVFSHLYEDFIERTLRHRIGEYYTPWWLVEFIIRRMKSRFNVNLAGKLVLDPACGSGRFLVGAFYEKVREGEDHQKAYYTVIGLDILPLAAAIARAELIIAYKRATGNLPPGTPLIFWGDFLSSEIGLEAELVSEFKDVIDRFAPLVWECLGELGGLSKHELTMLLARLEHRLAEIFKALSNCSDSKQVSKMIRNYVSEARSIKPVDNVEKAVNLIVEKVLGDNTMASNILKLIKNYGNGIWAVPIISHLFVKMLKKIKPDIVLTNPPWLLLSSLPESEWGKRVDEYVKNLIERHKKSIPGLSKTSMSGDISAVFLDIILKSLEEEGYVGIVMSAAQSYLPGSPHGTGRLLTYCALKDSARTIDGDAIYVGDVFGHGIPASVLILKALKASR